MSLVDIVQNWSGRPPLKSERAAPLRDSENHPEVFRRFRRALERLAPLARDARGRADPPRA